MAIITTSPAKASSSLSLSNIAWRSRLCAMSIILYGAYQAVQITFITDNVETDASRVATAKPLMRAPSDQSTFRSLNGISNSSKQMVYKSKKRKLEEHEEEDTEASKAKNSEVKPKIKKVSEIETSESKDKNKESSKSKVKSSTRDSVKSTANASKVSIPLEERKVEEISKMPVHLDHIWTQAENRDLVSEETRDAIYRQQVKWCLENRGVNGFQMIDASSCWAPHRFMSVINLTSSLYQDVYEVALEPLELLANKHIRLIGDSIARFLFTSMYFTLLNQQPHYRWPPKLYHSHISKTIPLANITIEWYWAPRAQDVKEKLAELGVAGILSKPDFNIIGIGNHQRRPSMMAIDFTKDMLDAVRDDYMPLMNNLVFQTAPRHQTDNVTQAAFEETFNSWLAREYSSRGINVVNTFWSMKVEDQSDGIHSPTHAKYAVFLHFWRWKWMSSPKGLHIRKLHCNTQVEFGVISSKKK